MSSGQYSASYRNYVLAILTVGYLLNFVDRQVMTILLEPIKAEFGATDTQMGFLSGFAFALFYATIAIPVARIADAWSRSQVLAISMGLWSFVTALCGTAGSFWQLALLRVGVGVGEAGGTPPSQALLADYFPPEKRSLALGIFSTAPNVGILVGLFGGAIIAELYGWRTVFFVFGIPGIFLALLLRLTVKEPIRSNPQDRPQSLLANIRTLFAIPSFPFIALAVGFTAISNYGFGVWSPSFLIRVHNLSLIDAGLYLGLIGAFGGGLGTVLGGYLCDRLTAKDPAWQLRLPVVGILLSLPLQIAFLLWPESSTFTLGEKVIPTTMVFLAVSSLFAGFWIAPTYAAVQNVVPAHYRTQAAALLLLSFNLLGMGLGPMLVGALSDSLNMLGADAIRYALLSSLVTVVVGAAIYWGGTHRYVNDLAALTPTPGR